MCDEKVDYNKILIGINTKVKTLDNKNIRAINFDNAATTPPFKSVIDKIIKLIPKTFTKISTALLIIDIILRIYLK